MYLVLARKWRPQSFDELVGQKHIDQTLSNAIRENRLAHAYIFAGLRGTGKTTVARILAKCLNCEQGPTTKPCNECASCQEVTQSHSMDVLEVDAASRTKVDQTRELLEVVNYAPVRDRYKILIIDEAHMLSKQSFNALLKTLEEPPPNVMFLLATTEVQKLLPTIVSRCQLFEFRRVGGRELAEHLRKICDTEKIQISDSTLERIARAGEGSVRDSLSVLERVLAFCGQKVDDDDVLRILGGVRSTVLTEMIGGIAARDAGAMLTVLDGLTDEGHDLLHFWSELIAAIRDLLLSQAVPDRADLLGRSAEESEALIEVARDLTRDDLSRIFQILADLEPALKSTAQPRYVFEATLIRLAALGSVRPIEELLATFDGTAPRTPAPAAPRSRTPPKKAADRPSAASLTPPPVEPTRAPAPPPAAPDSPTPSSDGAARHGDPVAARLIASVLDAKPMVGAMLDHAASVRMEERELVIAFTKNQSSFSGPLRDKPNLDLLEKHATAAAGQPVRVRIETVETSAQRSPTPRPAPKAKTPVVPAESDPLPETHARKTAASDSSRASLLEVANQDPGVQRLLHEFGAQVVEIGPDEAPPKQGGTRPLEDA